MKTAMQETIADIELQAKNYESMGLPLKAEALFDSLNLLRMRLIMEKQQITSAYDAGINDLEANAFKDASDYYSQTFTNNS